MTRCPSDHCAANSHAVLAHGNTFAAEIVITRHLWRWGSLLCRLRQRLAATQARAELHDVEIIEAVRPRAAGLIRPYARLPAGERPIRGRDVRHPVHVHANRF